MLMLLNACSDSTPPLQAGDLALRLAFSNNLDGETEPCG
jgi:hypothetical protein